jgi:hypothetical protein
MPFSTSSSNSFLTFSFEKIHSKKQVTFEEPCLLVMKLFLLVMHHYFQEMELYVVMKISFLELEPMELYSI